MDAREEKRCTSDLGRQLMGSRVDCALGGIERTEEFRPRYGNLEYGPPPKIRCGLHRMVMTGPYYTDNELRKLGGLRKHARPAGTNYRRNSISNVSGFTRIISTWPINCRRPTRIEVEPNRKRKVEPEPGEYKRALIDLMALPGLQVSEVEYAVDIYCKDAQSVINLFPVLVHYLWVPSKTHISLHGGQAEYGKNVRMNYVLHVKDHTTKIKVYERGPDRRRLGVGWPLNVCDRVRLEQTVKRAKLRYHSIDGLYDLIEHPKFFALNGEMYNFKEFRGPEKLPKPWEPYACEDNSSSPGAFQAQYLHFKGLKSADPQHVANVRQYMVDTEALIQFKAILIERMRDFDREWEMA